MDNVDIQIYVSQMKTFFGQNPDELRNLIGNTTPSNFFDGVRKVALSNYDNGDDIKLTNNQLIELIVELNNIKSETKSKEKYNLFMEHRLGKIYWN